MVGVCIRTLSPISCDSMPMCLRVDARRTHLEEPQILTSYINNGHNCTIFSGGLIRTALALICTLTFYIGSWLLLQGLVLSGVVKLSAPLVFEDWNAAFSCNLREISAQHNLWCIWARQYNTLWARVTRWRADSDTCIDLTWRGLSSMFINLFPILMFVKYIHIVCWRNWTKCCNFGSWVFTPVSV